MQRDARAQLHISLRSYTGAATGALWCVGILETSVAEERAREQLQTRVQQTPAHLHEPFTAMTPEGVTEQLAAGAPSFMISNVTIPRWITRAGTLEARSLDHQRRPRQTRQRRDFHTGNNSWNIP